MALALASGALAGPGGDKLDRNGPTGSGYRP